MLDVFRREQGDGGCCELWGGAVCGGCWLHMRGPWGALKTLPAQAAPITPDPLELMFKALQVIALGLESLGGGTIVGGRRELSGGWGRGTRQGLTRGRVWS